MLQITINGSDISSHIVSYTREKDLCSSEGITEFSLDAHMSISTYSVIRAYEDSTLKGTFYTDFTEKFSDGTMGVHGRDNSKRAQDYYIAEEFTAVGDTTSRYWIGFFLGLAGISYNFTTEDVGYTIQDGEVMGLTSCAEIVEMLVRYSGWYIFYDAENVAQIGKLEYDSTSYKAEFNDDDIISIQHMRSDQYLRNRAVVWGAGYIGGQEWVFADISVDTPWDYDSLDKRTILARAGFPVPFSQAIATANILLNEYARLVEEKTITVHGYHNLEIGDFVLIRSEYYSGVGLVSAINCSAEDSGGYTTTLVLDRRCPRFVGFYDPGGLIYAGTEEDGVWTKPLKGPHTWTDYSTGLTDLNVVDLDVSYGIASCTTSDGNMHVRTVGDTTWYPVSPGIHYTESGEVAVSGVYVASNINDIDQTIYGLWVSSSGQYRTWVDSFAGVTKRDSNLVLVSGDSYYRGIDIESNYDDLYVSVNKGIDSPYHNAKWNEVVDTDIEYIHQKQISFPGLSELYGNVMSNKDYIYSYSDTRYNIATDEVEELAYGEGVTTTCLLDNDIVYGYLEYPQFSDQYWYAYVDWNKTENQTTITDVPYPYRGTEPLPVVLRAGGETYIIHTSEYQRDSGLVYHGIRVEWLNVEQQTFSSMTIEKDNLHLTRYPQYYIDTDYSYDFQAEFCYNGFLYLFLGYTFVGGTLFAPMLVKIDVTTGTVVDEFMHRDQGFEEDDWRVRIIQQYRNLFVGEEEAVYFSGQTYYPGSAYLFGWWKISLQEKRATLIFGPIFSNELKVATLVKGYPYFFSKANDTVWNLHDGKTGEIIRANFPVIDQPATGQYVPRFVLRNGSGYLAQGIIWIVKIPYTGNPGYYLEGYNTAGNLVYNIALSDYTATASIRTYNRINKLIISQYAVSTTLIEFGTGLLTSAKAGSVLRKRDGEYNTVFTGGWDVKLDISTPNAISAYMSVMASGVIFISGEPYNYGAGLGNLWYSPFGDLGTFRLLHLPSMSGSYINDVRSFTLMSGDDFRTCIGFVVLSGLFGSVGQFSYIDVSEYESMGGTIVFPDIHTVANFNAVPVALETSNYNYMYTPYFLVGLSGVESPFLQRDYDTETFVDRSTYFPESRITTLRLDEMI